jgi:AcrR family transcriptional regulator
MPRVSDAHLASRRRQILAAALRCFAREGFHRTTMQDVVREAGLSPGAIYRYFRGKAEIVEAIADERHARERALLAPAMRRDDGLAALARDFLAPLADPDERRERRVGIQIWSEALRDPRILRIVRRGVDEPRARLAARVREGQAEGMIPAGLDPDAAARAMIALFHGFVLQQAWDPRVRPEPYLAVLEAALAALSARGGPEKPPRRRKRRPAARS